MNTELIQKIVSIPVVIFQVVKNNWVDDSVCTYLLWFCTLWHEI